LFFTQKVLTTSNRQCNGETILLNTFLRLNWLRSSYGKTVHVASGSIYTVLRSYCLIHIILLLLLYFGSTLLF